jgi:hypothetical protein
MSEAEAAVTPDLFDIVRTKVKPHRDLVNREAHRERWWLYGDARPGLVAATAELNRVLAIARVGQHALFAFLPNRMVYSEGLVIFPLATFGAFCALQARPHEAWARFFSSSMKDDLRYTPSDCFDTFPFPVDWRTNAALESAGETYYSFRAHLMAETPFRAEYMGGTEPEGLTKTHNRFHDPDERLPGILRLRELHAAMDRAVLDAYGWTDISTDCDFLLDYEIDEEEWGTKKKPYRYRWPDAVRDEVLARLLQLNQERAEAERLAGPVSKAESKSAKPKRALRRKKQAGQRDDAAPPSLFPSKERGSS